MHRSFNAPQVMLRFSAILNQSWKAAHLPTLEIRVEQGGIVPVGFELFEASQS